MSDGIRRSDSRDMNPYIDHLEKVAGTATNTRVYSRAGDKFEGVAALDAGDFDKTPLFYNGGIQLNLTNRVEAPVRSASTFVRVVEEPTGPPLCHYCNTRVGKFRTVQSSNKAFAADNLCCARCAQKGQNEGYIGQVVSLEGEQSAPKPSFQKFQETLLENLRKTAQVQVEAGAPVELGIKEAQLYHLLSACHECQTGRIAQHTGRHVVSGRNHTVCAECADRLSRNGTYYFYAQDRFGE